MVAATKYLSWGALILAACLACSCHYPSPSDPTPPEPPATNIIREEKTLQFRDLNTYPIKPSQVQFTFSLHEREGRTLFRPAAEIAAATRILENGVPLDSTETSFFVHTITRQHLELVLVLDFTLSMAEWRENNLSGVELIAQNVKQLIDSLGPANRIAIIEFHDRNETHSVISNLTSDKFLLKQALDRFLQSGIESSASSCWDALHAGVSLFPDAPKVNHEKIVLLISDGKDTSSGHTPEAIITLALKKNVRVHAIGTGAMPEHAKFENLARKTGGEYFGAAGASGFAQQWAPITRHLRQQFKLSYLTLKKTGTHAVRVEIDWAGETNYFEQMLDLGAIYDDDRVGRIGYEESGVLNQRAEIRFNADHLPRNIDKFRFRLDTNLPARWEIVKAQDGGLCEGWRLDGPDAQGYILLAAPAGASLSFGDSGGLCKVTFENLKDSGLILGCRFDNSIYAYGKRFDYPDTVYAGLPIVAPQPSDGATPSLDSLASLSWSVQNPRKLPLTFSVLFDTLDATKEMTRGLTAMNYVLPNEMTANKTYYWRVIAHSGERSFIGPKWHFRTK